MVQGKGEEAAGGEYYSRAWWQRSMQPAGVEESTWQEARAGVLEEAMRCNSACLLTANKLEHCYQIHTQAPMRNTEAVDS